MFGKAIEGINKLWGLKEIFHILFFWGYTIVINCAFFLWNGEYEAWIKKFEIIQKDGFKLTIFLTIFIVIFFIFHTIFKWTSSFLIRVYEGYEFPQMISACLKDWMYRKRQKLEEKVNKYPQKLESLTLNYPTESEFIMPTRLGNILKAAELYPWIRYDIDAVAIWPRLFQLLTKEQAQGIVSLKNDMVLLLSLSWISYLSSLVWIVLNWFLISWFVTIVVILSGLFGYLFYRLSLVPALNYGLMIRVMFDLYRVPLLKALGEEKVQNLSEEIEVWQMINNHINKGDLSDKKLLKMFIRKKE